jgi:lipopolysaccharide transport system permease protein
LNPTLLMLVYALVFSVFMKQRVENYTYFMFVGLLPWIWFSSSVGAGASAVSDRRDLLTKVRFPPQLLPASVVITNLCNYLLAFPLVLILGAAFGVFPSWHIVVLPVVMVVQLMFTLGLLYIVSALNVTLRDLQHIVTNLITLWFFLTPIFYPVTTIPERYRDLLVYGNPMAILITSQQAILLEHRLPAAGPLALVALEAVLLLWMGSEVFERRREEFAELV